jgi:hypothetical protein
MNEWKINFNFLEFYPSSVDLIRDRYGTIFESKRLQPKEFTPNIDNSLLAFDTTVENTLHSYFMLFCRRCYRYDCFIHKDKAGTPDSNNQSKNSNRNYRPCNSYCYRNKSISSYQQRRAKAELKRSHSELVNNAKFQTPVNGFYSKRIKSNIIKSEQLLSSSIPSSFYQNGFLFKPSLKRKLNNEISNWLSSEKSLFRIFHTIYGDNICLIADLLDKSCSQVYTFYSNERNLFLQRQLSTIGALSDMNSVDTKINGEEWMDYEMKMCNGTDNQQSVRIHLHYV